MSPPEDRSVGELARAVDRLTAMIERLDHRIDQLSNIYVQREVWDLAQGANRVDIGRIDHEIVGIDKRITDVERERASQFRQTVFLGISALLGPLFVGVVIWLLTQQVEP